MASPKIQQKPRTELQWMDVVREYDTELYLHSLAVGELTARFAVSLGFSPSEQDCLTTGALLHDLGKVKLPIDVLNQSHPLTTRERRLLRTHPEI